MAIAIHKVERGFEGKSTRRHHDTSFGFQASKALGEIMIAWMNKQGKSERAMCCDAEIDRRTWRRSTGRPYPKDNGGISMLTVRDFIAASDALGLDPVCALEAALSATVRETGE